MDTQDNRRVALMSIHPRFANQIVQGTKRVEFRKRRLAEDITHVLVYATAPEGRIIAWFEIARQTAAPPQSIWESFGQVGGIAEHDFFAYYGQADAGVAIEIANVHALDEPWGLDTHLGLSRPPQSFQYVEVPDSLLHSRGGTSLPECGQSRT